MQTWEYKIITQTMDDERQVLYWGNDTEDNKHPEQRLNEFGAEGWELVSTAVISSGLVIIYYFRRPI